MLKMNKFRSDNFVSENWMEREKKEREREREREKSKSQVKIGF